MMKILLVSFLLLISLGLHGQQEFFGDENGLSFGYLRGIHTKVRISAFDYGIYLKNGITAEIGFQRIDTELVPVVGIGYLFKSRIDPNFPRPYIGLSYTTIYGNHFISTNLSIIKCFFFESNFPFSITGLASAQFRLGENNSSSGRSDIAYGIGYTQGFFAREKIHPFIGVSYSADTESTIELITGMIGINIRLSGKKEYRETTF